MVGIRTSKIIYSCIFALTITVFSQCAYAHETVKSVEILSKAEKEQLLKEKNKNSIYESVNNSLGQDYYKIKIDPDRKEFAIKSIGDVIKDRKERKKAKLEAMNAQEKKQSNFIQINCREMEYFDDKNELEARDDVEILTPTGVRVTAGKAIYNKDANTIKLIDNIVLTRNDANVYGDYMLIDLNEENAIMDNPTTKMGNLVINAKEGYAYPNRIENINGNVELNKRVEMELYSRGFVRYGRAINDTRLVDFDLKKERSKPYSFKTKEVEIRPEKDHDSMVLKNVDIYRNKRRILNVPSIELFADKERTYSEVNFPLEYGSLKGFGMYLGMGYTFKMPKTYTMRLTPAVVYGDDKFGIGGMAQLKSDRLRLETGWASSTNNLIADGSIKLADKLNLELGRHVYKGEWLNGGTRAGYIADLVYDDSYLVKDLGDAIFRHRISAGYVADYKREHQEDNMDDGYRYRYQAELSKKLRSFGSSEQDMFLNISAVAQTMATIYSETGDTVGLFRVGPRIQSRVKRWNSIIQYTVGGLHGNSPYSFDEYRYGRQTISFDESLILNRYLSIGYKGTLTPLKDNNDRDILTENRFYAVAGPDDFKIAFSYDTIRQNMHFDFLFLLGSDNIDLRYEKLTVKEPDKIGKPQRKASDKDLYKVKIPETL